MLYTLNTRSSNCIRNTKLLITIIYLNSIVPSVKCLFKTLLECTYAKLKIMFQYILSYFECFFITKKKRTTRIPGITRYDERKLSCTQARVNAFAHLFSNVYIKSDCLGPFCTMNETATQLSVAITHYLKKIFFLPWKTVKTHICIRSWRHS